MTPIRESYDEIGLLNELAMLVIFSVDKRNVLDIFVRVKNRRSEGISEFVNAVATEGRVHPERETAEYTYWSATKSVNQRRTLRAS